MDVKKFTVDGGIRAEERVSRTDLSEDSYEQVVEQRREVVPMRTAKKVTQKFKSLPVEEKIEVFEEDGSVKTTLKTLSDESLGLQEKTVSLNDVLDKLSFLEQQVVPVHHALGVSKVSQEVRNQLAAVEDLTFEETELEEDGKTKMLTTACWILVALIVAFIAYALI